MELKMIVYLVLLSFLGLFLFGTVIGCQLYVELKKDKSEGWTMLPEKDNQKAVLAFEMEIAKINKNGYAKLGQVIALQNLG